MRLLTALSDRSLLPCVRSLPLRQLTAFGFAHVPAFCPCVRSWTFCPLTGPVFARWACAYWTCARWANTRSCVRSLNSLTAQAIPDITYLPQRPWTRAHLPKNTYFHKHIDIMIKIRDVAARLNALGGRAGDPPCLVLSTRQVCDSEAWRAHSRSPSKKHVFSKTYRDHDQNT